MVSENRDRDTEDGSNEQANPRSKVEQADRPRGLSKSDRQYLLGENKIEKQSQAERNTRQRIRERTLNAFLDNSLLQSYLDARDKVQILNFDSDASPEDQQTTTEALVGTAALLYELSKYGNQPFEEVVAEGIRRIETTSSSTTGLEIGSPEITVSIEVDPPREINLNTLNQKISQGNISALSPNEMLLLIVLFYRTDGTDRGDIDVLLSTFVSKVEEEWSLPEELDNLIGRVDNQ